jgi:hypothetical protein
MEYRGEFRTLAEVKAMALNAEIKNHLHSLMVEVYEKTVDETQQQTRSII